MKIIKKIKKEVKIAKEINTLNWMRKSFYKEIKHMMKKMDKQEKKIEELSNE